MKVGDKVVPIYFKFQTASGVFLQIFTRPLLCTVVNVAHPVYLVPSQLRTRAEQKWFTRSKRDFVNRIMKPKHCFVGNNSSDKITKTANFKYMQMCDYSAALKR